MLEGGGKQLGLKPTWIELHRLCTDGCAISPPSPSNHPSRQAAMGVLDTFSVGSRVGSSVRSLSGTRRTPGRDSTVRSGAYRLCGGVAGQSDRDRCAFWSRGAARFTVGGLWRLSVPEDAYGLQRLITRGCRDIQQDDLARRHRLQLQSGRCNGFRRAQVQRAAGGLHAQLAAQR